MFHPRGGYRHVAQVVNAHQLLVNTQHSVRDTAAVALARVVDQAVHWSHLKWT